MSLMGGAEVQRRGDLLDITSCNAHASRAESGSRHELITQPPDARIQAMEALSKDSEGHQNVASELALGCRSGEVFIPLICVFLQAQIIDYVHMWGLHKSTVSFQKKTINTGSFCP